MTTKAELVGNKQLSALTGLRILAALWVFFHHLSAELFTFASGLLFMKPIVERGGLGVDLFFILSGFILTYQYFGRLGPTFEFKSFVKFINLRIARVYPVHFVTLHVSVGLFFAAKVVGVGVNEDGASRTFSAYLQNLLLVHAWNDQPYSWNAVSWSVSAEWFAYLTFPVAIVILYKIRRRVSIWAGIVFTIAAYTSLGMFILPPGTSDGPDHVLIRIAVGFILGCLLARIYARTPTAGRQWKWLTPVSTCLIFALCYIPNLQAGFFLPLFGILVLGLAHGSDIMSRILTLAPFRYGGEISYSLYMVHGIVLSLARKLIPDNAEQLPLVFRIILLGSIVGAALLSAHFLYRWVEEPCRKFLRKVGSRDKALPSPGNNSR